jgi:hypothetical protein
MSVEINTYIKCTIDYFAEDGSFLKFEDFLIRKPGSGKRIVTRGFLGHLGDQLLDTRCKDLAGIFWYKVEL